MIRFSTISTNLSEMGLELVESLGLLARWQLPYVMIRFSTNVSMKTHTYRVSLLYRYFPYPTGVAWSAKHESGLNEIAAAFQLRPLTPRP